ncbi:MAG: UDP-N-acetylmuramoyl-L-alanine--D-glutamate ligase [Deltaproteobacteria bacterium]|nr:UDP-N-acetylmuramoyl-L-alanine--D-glutamate ligase [Deltaproteobacteria bacterium]
MELAGKRVFILGLDQGVVSAAQFLTDQKVRVTVFARTPRSIHEKVLASLKKISCDVQWGEVEEKRLCEAGLLVAAPGYRFYRWPLSLARRKGVPICSLLELAGSFYKKPVIAVTGSNGKTSTIVLLQAFLKKGGVSHAVAGGSFASYFDLLQEKGNVDYFVLETGSFELEGTQKFHPWIAVFLNVGAEHRDRHGTLKKYLEAKGKIFANQQKGDFIVYRHDSKLIAAMLSEKKAVVTTVPFCSSKKISPGIYRDGKKLVYGDKGKEESYSLEDFQLKGVHNIENLMAAIVVARLCGVSAGTIRETIGDLRWLPHRLERTDEIQGVTFYNDAKSTNTVATAWALGSFTDKVILIMGGRWRGGSDLEGLTPFIRSKVKILVIIGSNRMVFHKNLGDLVPTFVVPKIADAVELAYKKAITGDTVLFSPAAPTEFSVHPDFRARGEDFKKAVNSLKESLVKKRLRSSRQERV